MNGLIPSRVPSRPHCFIRTPPTTSSGDSGQRRLVRLRPGVLPEPQGWNWRLCFLRLATCTTGVGYLGHRPEQASYTCVSTEQSWDWITHLTSYPEPPTGAPQPIVTIKQTSIGVPFPGTVMTFEVDMANSGNLVGQFPTLLISGGAVTNVALGSSATGLSKSITTTALDATYYSDRRGRGNPTVHVPDGPVLTFS